MNSSLFRTRIAVLTGVLLLALSLPAQAGHKAKHAGKHAGKHAAITQTFTVAAGAKISVAGNKAATLANVNVGDHVKITYTQANGVLTASHIKDAGPHPAKHAKHAKAHKHGAAHKHHKKGAAGLHARGIVQSVDASGATLTITETHKHKHKH